MGIFGGYQQSRRVRELEDRLETVERQVKALRSEWDDTYDKIRVSMARIVRRAAVVESAEEPKARTPDAPLPSRGLPEGSNGRLLSHDQLQHQQRILRRRAGL